MAYSATADESQPQIAHIVVDPSELPIEVVLRSFEFGASGYAADWTGPAQGARGTVTANIKLSAGLWASPEDALNGVRLKLMGIAVRIPEVTGEATQYAVLGDRVWHLRGRILFMKGRALVDVFAYVSENEDKGPEVALQLSQVMSRKIGALLAGKPEPVPVIPFLSSRGTRDGVTTEEQGIEWAWAVKKLQESWGEQGTTLVFVDDNGLPRGIPAKRVGASDYLVQLTDLAALLDKDWRKQPSQGSATLSEVTILGKRVRAEIGRREVSVDGKAVGLGAQVEWAGPVKSAREDKSWPIMLVPLSLAEKALGVKVEFSKHGDLPKITLRPLKEE